MAGRLVATVLDSAYIADSEIRRKTFGRSL